MHNVNAIASADEAENTVSFPHKYITRHRLCQFSVKNTYCDTGNVEVTAAYRHAAVTGYDQIVFAVTENQTVVMILTLPDAMLW